MCGFMYLPMSMYVCMYVLMYVCMYGCMNAFILIFMNVSPYVYTHYVIHKLRNTKDYMSE